MHACINETLVTCTQSVEDRRVSVTKPHSASHQVDMGVLQRRTSQQHPMRMKRGRRDRRAPITVQETRVGLEVREEGPVCVEGFHRVVVGSTT